jgi:hypothetical protein
MLIPDNIHPEQTIYFNGAFVLKVIQKHRVENMLELYIKTKAEWEMSMPVFVLCLDWLFLLNLIMLNDSGKVELALTAENSTPLWSHHSILRSYETWLPEWSGNLGGVQRWRSSVARGILGQSAFGTRWRRRDSKLV